MKIFGTLCTAAATAAFINTATADEYIYATFFGPSHTLITEAVVPSFERIKEATNSEIDFRIAAGGQLLSANSALGGLRDGLAHAAAVTHSFYPAELPLANIIYDMQMYGDDVVAVAGATHEMLITCGECWDEWTSQKNLVMATYIVPAYRLLCRNARIETVADLAGKKMDGTGALAVWLRSLGAVPVTMSSTEAAEAVERGSLDCLGGAISWLKSYGLADVLNSILDFPLSSPRGMALIAINADTWMGFTPEQRKLIWDEMAMTTASASLEYLAADEAERAKMPGGRVELIEPGEDWAQAKAEFIASQEEPMIQTAISRGVDEELARRVVADYKRLLEEWKALSAEIGTDQEKFAAALKERAYSKRDPEALF